MTYHSLTPRQQRVWDAAYGAALAAELKLAENEHCESRREELSKASLRARLTANLAANSIQPNDDG